jgi:hypothetical protein
MARYFTLDQAQTLLPEVEGILRDAVFHKSEYQKAHEELERTTRKIRMSGGAQVNPASLLAARARRDTSAAALKEALEKIEGLGAVVKDLDLGLIDFMTRYRNQEVCLCWKLGEDAIRFWHGAEEGYRGRKPIDQEFLQQHRGEPTQ